MNFKNLYRLKEEFKNKTTARCWFDTEIEVVSDFLGLCQSSKIFLYSSAVHMPVGMNKIHPFWAAVKDFVLLNESIDFGLGRGNATGRYQTIFSGLRIVTVLLPFETSVSTAFIVNIPLKCISNGQYQFYPLPIQSNSNSLSKKMGNFLLSIKGINHKYIVVGRII